MSEFPNHAQGEPCPVIDLLIGHFGAKVGEALLWNYTCFPMSDEHAYEQARRLVAADRVGLFDEYIRSEDELIERQMADAATRA